MTLHLKMHSSYYSYQQLLKLLMIIKIYYVFLLQVLEMTIDLVLTKLLLL